MQRQEIRNHTDEQIREAVAFALALVEEVAPPSDLREATFTLAANLWAQKSIVLQQGPPLLLGGDGPRGGIREL